MEKRTTKKSTTIIFIVSTVVFALVLVGAIVGLFVSMNKMNAYGTSLEQVYQRSYYDFEDNINNAQNKMGKLLASSSGTYQKKLVKEIADNAKSAQSNISVLPVSASGLSSSVKFINQFYGYMSSLETQIDKNGKLTGVQKEKLNELYQTIKELKYNLSNFTQKLENGYSILSASKNVDGNFNNLTKDLKRVKGEDIDYPSMIYDGPFADSVLNQKIKGLNFDEVDSMMAEQNLRSVYEGYRLENIKYLGETNGKFSTHDFSFYCDGLNLVAQMTKKGGRLLTLSGWSGNSQSKIDFSQAQNIAKSFCNNAKVGDLEVVWSDEKTNEAYFNLAPKQNGAILYPDLIKVKVDKTSGMVVGFEACSYYTNHIERNIPGASLTSSNAQQYIENGYNIQSSNLCIAPLDYGREELCYEFKCDYLGSVYYIYINAQNGAEENILQVVSSSSGQKLM